MKKRVFSVLMAMALCVSSLVGCGAGSKTETKPEAAAETTAEPEVSPAATCEESEFDAIKDQYGDEVYAPQEGYDVYTVFEYTIESAGATFAATVSKKADDSEYYLHFNFYGDEQIAVWNGEEVIEDKTGFMQTDTPLIVEAAEAYGKWAPIQ